MAYDQAFYDLYEAYLHEPAVRKAHDWVFSIVRTYPELDSVLDLGCGQNMEYLRHVGPNRYLGIDLNPRPDASHVIQGDYRKLNWLELPPVTFRSFISLFSSEITEHYHKNYVLYNDIFMNLSTINVGVVAGFYYAKRMHMNPVTETGGIVSWQTLESLHEAEREATCFTERRIILPVPSRMFGPDVYEVWKIFERR